jgi:hypothetical protein
MKCHRSFRLAMPVVMTIFIIGFGALVAAEEEKPAQPSEQIGIEGTYVRVATDQKGWVVVGYRIANESVDKNWMLLDVGMTVMKGQEAQKITRDDIKLVTPNHEVISLPTQEEYEKAHGSVLPLVQRAARAGDSINYFPAAADDPCSLEFFSEPGGPRVRLAYDEVELSYNRACVGRVYFEVPDGIQYGLYNFDVRFENSIVKVPIDIMTKEQAKEFTKEWKKALKESRHEGHEH